jgi:SAM-dependent methyltransferase
MKERFDIIREICRGKSCLDVGLVGSLQHRLEQPEKWVFHHVLQVARDLTGLDLDCGSLAILRARGHRHLVCANAERFALRKRFDVIVAGEIIEHLDNPGAFLTACREHLTPDGRLVLTTPNTFSVNNLIKGLVVGRVGLFHEHVNAYTVELLAELLRRHAFRLTDIAYCTERNPGLKNRIFRLLSRLRPTWSEGLVVVAQPAGPSTQLAGTTASPRRGADLTASPGRPETTMS